jgi:hypothetical protein
MYSKRSVGQPSKSENVARKSKKRKILNQGLYQRSTMSELCHGQTRSLQGLYSVAYKILQSGLQTKQSKFTDFNFFIPLNVVWLFYITFN